MGLFTALIGLSQSSSLAQAAADYKITAQDIIIIDVVGEKDLNRELRVSTSGTITFPFLGVVTVEGKTPAEVEQEIRQKLDADYIVDPQVIVSVKEYRLRTVQVLGAVMKPGSIPLPGEQKVSLIDAIGLAGGMNLRANEDKIEFTRAGKTEVFTFKDLKKISDPAKMIYLEPGDIIKVGERFL